MCKQHGRIFPGLQCLKINRLILHRKRWEINHLDLLVNIHTKIFPARIHKKSPKNGHNHLIITEGILIIGQNFHFIRISNPFYAFLRDYIRVQGLALEFYVSSPKSVVNFLFWRNWYFLISIKQIEVPYMYYMKIFCLPRCIQLPSE